MYSGVAFVAAAYHPLYVSVCPSVTSIVFNSGIAIVDASSGVSAVVSPASPDPGFSFKNLKLVILTVPVREFPA